MPSNYDFIGKRFGRLKILRVFIKRSVTFFDVVCDCGTSCSKNASNVRRGFTISCGCRLRETWAEQDKGYRSRTSRTYCSWENMHNRCNPNNRQHKPSYHGITVCKRWSGRNGFGHFLADMGERPPRKSLERINNRRGYFPYNCKWATKKEQQNNRRACRRTSDGLTIQQYAERNRLTYMQAWHKLTGRGLLLPLHQTA